MPRSRAAFTTSVEGVTALLIDLDGESSITNDAEAVVTAVYERHRVQRILYRDTEKQWGELKFSIMGPDPKKPAAIRRVKFDGFAPVSAEDQEKFMLSMR